MTSRLRERVWGGEIGVLDPKASSRALASRALEIVAAAFARPASALAEVHEALGARELWRRTCAARAALVADSEARALAVSLARDLGYGASTLAFDAARLRVVAPGAHEDPAAARAFYMHRDTWYGSPRAQLNAWIPLFDVDERDSLALYPAAFGAPVDNDSGSFDYDAFRAAGGFQSEASIPSAYPRCLGVPPPPVKRVPARAGEVVVFSAAQLHGTAPNEAGRTRYSIDLRLVDLEDHDRGLGAPDVDNRSRGSALADYLRPVAGVP